MNAFYGNGQKKKPIKLAQKFRASVASGQNKEVRDNKRPSFQIFDLPRSVLQAKERQLDHFGSHNENHHNVATNHHPNNSQKRLSLFDNAKKISTDDENRRRFDRRTSGPILKTSPLQQMEFSPPREDNPFNSNPNQFDKNFPENNDNKHEFQPLKSLFAKQQKKIPHIPSKQFSNISETLASNDNLTIPSKVRSHFWKKLRSAFKFIVMIKRTYQEKLTARKQNCEKFYTENYQFVIQSVVSFLTKPIHDVINSLLDIKKNFDIVSEVQTSRITFQNLNILKASSLGHG